MPNNDNVNGLERQRRSLLSDKQSSMQRIVFSRKRKLRELYNVRQIVLGAGRPPSPYQVAKWAQQGGAADDEGEEMFLAANDITQRRWYDDSTLLKLSTPTSPSRSLHAGEGSAPCSPRKKQRLDDWDSSKKSPSAKSGREEEYEEKRTQPIRTYQKPFPRDKASQSTQTSIPATPSPSPLSGPSDESTEEPASTSAAVVGNVDGVPTIQETSTELPTDREKTFGVRPPPPPDPDLELSPPPLSPELPKPLPDEIPDSQPSPITTTPLQASEEAHPHATERPPHHQLPSNLPQVVIQNDSNHPSPVAQLALRDAKTPALEASSPASETDILSTPEKASATTSERLGRKEISTANEDRIKQPEQDALSKERSLEMAKSPLPSISAEVHDEKPELAETASSVSPQMLSATEQGPSKRAITPPDPSAQLRLENDLANGTPGPKEVALTVARSKSRNTTPLSGISDDRFLPPKEHEMLDEEEDEDRVQLVGSHEPGSRTATPPVRLTIEPEVQAIEPTVKESTPLSISQAVDSEATSEQKPEIDDVIMEEATDRELSEERPGAVSKSPVPDEEQATVGRSATPARHKSVEPIKKQDLLEASVEPVLEEEEVEEVISPVRELDQAGTLAASSLPPTTPEVSGKEVDNKHPVDATPSRPTTEVSSPADDYSSQPLGLLTVDTPLISQLSPDIDNMPSTSSPEATSLDQEAGEDLEKEPSGLTPEQPSPMPVDLTTAPSLLVPHVPSSEPSPNESLAKMPNAAERATGKRSHSPDGLGDDQREPHWQLKKVAISSTPNASSWQATPAQRLREDQEQQGIIVSARRRNQQMEAAAARTRPSQFQSGSRLDVMTQINIAEPGLKAGERAVETLVDPYRCLWTIMSTPEISTNNLLGTASKTVDTNAHHVNRFEKATEKVLKTVNRLQMAGDWCLSGRPKREPPRKMVHWDYLLKDVKWLREDFREERKWKIAAAKAIADSVVEWHKTPAEPKHLRARLCFVGKRKGRVPTNRDTPMQQRAPALPTSQSSVERPAMTLGHSASDGDTAMTLMSDSVESGPSPDAEADEMDVDVTPVKQERLHEPAIVDPERLEGHEPYEGPAPAEVFTLAADDFVFPMPSGKEREELFSHFKVYRPQAPPREGLLEDAPEDYLGPQGIIPVSKYSLAQVVLKPNAVRPKSRYSYPINEARFGCDTPDEESYDAVDDGYASRRGSYADSIREKHQKPAPIPPEQTNVGLFRQELQPTLQRLRNHAFLPPMPPPPSFFDFRMSSHWTPQDDEELRALVKEFDYNWLLIASLLQYASKYVSGAHRRSSWECYERWQMLHPGPPENSKVYTIWRTAQARLEYAQKAGFGPIVNQPGMQRRRHTLPISVEKHRTPLGHFSMLDAMRKVAKKRETAHVKNVNAQRNAMTTAQRAKQVDNQQQAHNGQNGNVAPQKSPQDPRFFSSLKQERLRQEEDQANRVKAQRQAMINQRMPANGRLPHTQMPNGMPMSAAGQARLPAHLPPMGMNGRQQNGYLQVPQAQMHPGYGQRPISQYDQLRLSQLAAQRAVNNLGASPNQQILMQQAQSAALGHRSAGLPPNAPSFSEVLTRVRADNPHFSEQQTSEQAHRALAAYHAKLTQAHTRSPVGQQSQPPPQRPQGPPQQVRSASSNGGTGVLIGANGPVGPGAREYAAREAASRAGTPNGVGQLPGSPMVAAASPRMGSGSPGISTPAPQAQMLQPHMQRMQIAQQQQQGPQQSPPQRIESPMQQPQQPQ